MGLVQATMLAGLAAAAVPILVHLLFRRRARPVDLGTLRFLAEALRENVRRRKLKRRDTKEEAVFCKQSLYKSGGYKLTLKGIEDLGGKNAYVVEIEKPGGKKETEYYDMATSFLLKTASTETGPDGNPSLTSVEFSDYKEVSGVLVAHSMIMTGMLPIPMKATLTEIKINLGVDDAIFKN